MHILSNSLRGLIQSSRHRHLRAHGMNALLEHELSSDLPTRGPESDSTPETSIESGGRGPAALAATATEPKIETHGQSLVETRNATSTRAIGEGRATAPDLSIHNVRADFRNAESCQTLNHESPPLSGLGTKDLSKPESAPATSIMEQPSSEYLHRLAICNAVRRFRQHHGTEKGADILREILTLDRAFELGCAPVKWTTKEARQDWTLAWVCEIYDAAGNAVATAIGETKEEAEEHAQIIVGQ